MNGMMHLCGLLAACTYLFFEDISPRAEKQTCGEENREHLNNQSPPQAENEADRYAERPIWYEHKRTSAEDQIINYQTVRQFILKPALGVGEHREYGVAKVPPLPRSCK